MDDSIGGQIVDFQKGIEAFQRSYAIGEPVQLVQRRTELFAYSLIASASKPTGSDDLP